jgi:hypothetical protein
MRTVVAANVQALLDYHYRTFDNETSRLKALSRDCGLTPSTIKRVLLCTTGSNLETLEALSLAFGVSVYQLVAPSIDPANPPVIKGATEQEKKLYAQWRRAGSLLATHEAST